MQWLVLQFGCFLLVLNLLFIIFWPLTACYFKMFSTVPCIFCMNSDIDEIYLFYDWKDLSVKIVRVFS
jgi:hypothetical protein